MSIFSSSAGPSTTGSSGLSVTTPEIENITVASANIEYTHTLPANTKYFKLKSRNDSVIKLSFTNGESNVKYIKICPGFQYESPVSFEIGASISLYFQTSKINEVIEIESWR